ncbi:unnamed protein product [Vitrella brassicaformis CCMP3155]|uniref:Uncharacterized protein n=2 Tax=Vitrella brassicaformis TaxID=1169539 RepID=A0A0G4GJV6_VITBC|nr:unnamed protein product [Vitrella brassicaformis CCMP3155]|eukprot:CEM30207.1 unnamed protein product [Vitrella brassicaformis CCMP3155]
MEAACAGNRTAPGQQGAEWESRIASGTGVEQPTRRRTSVVRTERGGRRRNLASREAVRLMGMSVRHCSGKASMEAARAVAPTVLVER